MFSSISSFSGRFAAGKIRRSAIAELILLQVLGGNGGRGGSADSFRSGGGGGAGGYYGDGGQGADGSTFATSATAGQGGGGGGGGSTDQAHGGGGVGMFGAGANGIAGTTSSGGGGGSGGEDGAVGIVLYPGGKGGEVGGGSGANVYGGHAGGGGGGLRYVNHIPVTSAQTYYLTIGAGGDVATNRESDGANGAMRIMFGNDRSYPFDAANVSDQQVLFNTPGIYEWEVPEGVNSISVLCVGGGASPWIDTGDPNGSVIGTDGGNTIFATSSNTILFYAEGGKTPLSEKQAGLGGQGTELESYLTLP